VTLPTILRVLGPVVVEIPSGSSIALWAEVCVDVFLRMRNVSGAYGRSAFPFYARQKSHALLPLITPNVEHNYG